MNQNTQRMKQNTQRMKRIIILLLVVLTCQAGRAITVDRFFKKYKKAAGVEYTEYKNIRAYLARQLGMDADVDMTVEMESDTLLAPHVQTFQQALGSIVQADLKHKDSMASLRLVEVSEVVDKTVTAMTADLKALEIGSEYDEVFSAQTENGSWHIYLKEVGPFYEVLVTSTEHLALAQITGIKKSSLSALLKLKKK